ncbi:PEP-CTERM sorting domain-containing protein [Massilia oculi]|uniref:PEP-CTERM sorting domain-containing protein n=1 Tax=Massilia hydrophila TaxID=3044279 RepID=A0ABS7Y8J1_9BURK|nr:choice-of-anchor K domain-containing protein [Massilia oculi]MCA1856007.1 PEP-CTERM sorting domain-containing protein [Massilia oculi]
MNFFRSTLLHAALVLPVLFGAGSAQATTIQGSSDGKFSNVSHCWGTCYVFDRSGKPDSKLEWGFGLFTNGSTLVAQERQWNVDLAQANDVVLAELVWTNRATVDWLTPDRFNVDYTLNIRFNQPNAVSDKEVFNFSILNTANPAGDVLMGLTLADLSGLSFALDGLEISDLKYQLAGAGSFDGTYWFNPESRTSTMYITADFKAKAPAIETPPPASEVPEPASMALFAAGLLGLGFLRARKAH